MQYKFNQRQKNEVQVILDYIVMPKCKYFWYLRAVFEEINLRD